MYFNSRYLMPYNIVTVTDNSERKIANLCELRDGSCAIFVSLGIIPRVGAI